jgi:hypothetical protein
MLNLNEQQYLFNKVLVFIELEKVNFNGFQQIFIPKFCF